MVQWLVGWSYTTNPFGSTPTMIELILAWLITGASGIFILVVNVAVFGACFEKSSKESGPPAVIEGGPPKRLSNTEYCKALNCFCCIEDESQYLSESEIEYNQNWYDEEIYEIYCDEVNDVYEADLLNIYE